MQPGWKGVLPRPGAWDRICLWPSCLGTGRGIGKGLAHPSCSLCSDAHGVYQLATLLMELDREDESSHLLAADALYRLGHLEDAHKALLVALSRRPQATAVLVRLALLQLHRGFSYDANRVRRPQGQQQDRQKPAQCHGDTRPLVAPPSAPHFWSKLYPNLQLSHHGRSLTSLTSLTFGVLCALVLHRVRGIHCSGHPRAQQSPSMQGELRMLLLCCEAKGPRTRCGLHFILNSPGKAEVHLPLVL